MLNGENQFRIHHFVNRHNLNKSELDYDFESIQKHIPANKTSYATHSFYEYPAKFMPQFPYIFIKNLSKKNDKVLDPMCGIGTTVIESCILNRKGFGVDIDPIGRFVSKVSITPIEKSEMRLLNNKLIKTLANRFDNKDYLNTPLPNSKEFPNLDIWFREETFKELLLVKGTISDLFENNKDYRDFAIATLMSIIKKVSNADPRDLMPERDKDMLVRPKQDVLKMFSDALEEKSRKVIDFSEQVNYERRGEIIGNDARKTTLEDNSIDLVVTSPPYAYAVDYARVTKLSALTALMVYDDMKKIAKSYIGTDKVSLKEELGSFRGFEFIKDEVNQIYNKDKKCAIILYRYLKDMFDVTKEMSRVLKKDGHLVYVIGDATIKKTHFSTSDVLAKFCEKCGFSIEKTYKRPYYARRMASKRASHSNVTQNDVFIVAKRG